MIKQMGEDKGNIDALMSGGHYDPAAVTGAGEGADATPNEPSMYVGDKKPRVGGGTAGFAVVPPVGQPAQPYPEIDADLFEAEDVHQGLWAGSAAMTPNTEMPGNSQVVGDMTTGMPRAGTFSGATKLVGDMATGRPTGGEQGAVAPLVGDLVTGMPTDDYPREEHMPSEISPDGLITGDAQGGYTPGAKGGVGPTIEPANPGKGGPTDDRWGVRK